MPVSWAVDCTAADTFLYAAITNVTELGIFVRTTQPLAIGTLVVLSFEPPNSGEAFRLSGVVQWTNPLRPFAENVNPGMGIRFEPLSLEDRQRLVRVIKTLAYVHSDN